MRARRLILTVIIYYALCCVVLAIALAELAFRPPRIPVTQRERVRLMAARFGAELRDVSTAGQDGVRLQAWYAHPAHGNSNAVILLHGVGDNREGMAGFAELFLSRGYAVLLPDSRAHGNSAGDFPTYGVQEADDVQQWFAWLTATQRPDCIFGMGESMGAAVVLQSAKSTPFCAVIAESPFASFRRIAYIRVGQMFLTGEWLGRVMLRPAVELALLYGRITRGVYLGNASPENAVAQSRIPVLLIHGLADDNIPAQQSHLIRASREEDVLLWEVPEAGHCGAVAVAPQEFNYRVLDWFSSHSRPRASAAAAQH